MTTTIIRPAGWYPDDAPNTERYWDGDKWTFQTRTMVGERDA